MLRVFQGAPNTFQLEDIRISREVDVQAKADSTTRVQRSKGASAKEPGT